MFSEREFHSVIKQIVENDTGEELFYRKDGQPVPNRNTIIQIILGFRQIIFPGYFDEKNAEYASSEILLKQELIRLYNNLESQILAALIQQEKSSADLLYLTQKTEQICTDFFSSFPNIRELLLKDVQAAYDGDPAAHSKEEIIFCYPGLFTILVYRIAHELYRLQVPFLPRIMSEYAHSHTGIDIHPGAVIGEYFFIDHGTGVVIGETTTIGNHVKIYQGVTLGALSTRSGQLLRNVKRHPDIEDYVTIYSNATILGGKTVIGKGAVIGGNAFITESIAAGSRVSAAKQELSIMEKGANDTIFD